MKHAKIPLGGKLGKGKYMLVDTEDVSKIASHKWHLNDNGYAVNRSRVDGRNTTIRAHRLIMSTPTGMDTDHINHNKIDNRKSNLRVCTRSDNLKNRKDAKCYYYSKKRDRWVVDSGLLGIGWKQFKTEKEAKIFVNNKKKELGL